MADLDTYRPTLTIRVLWLADSVPDPADELKTIPGSLDRLAESLFSVFSRSTDNPLDRGMGIPVFFHSKQPPKPSVLKQSRHSILVALVDDRMVINPAWNEGLMALGQAVSAAGDRHRLYPASLSSNAFNIGPTVAVTNFIRLHRLPAAEHAARLSSTLTHELCRLLLAGERSERGAVPANTRLSPAPVMLFLSHAKADGEELAEALRDHIESTSAVQSFFDANDIAPGFDFRSELEGNIERSVLVVLQTDHYASRTWCRREVLWAKSKGCPLVVVNAVHEREERGFPYLGNAPSLRVDGKDPGWCTDVVGLALREMLRHSWFRANLADLEQVGLIPRGMEPSPCPPEILTLLTRSTAAPEAGLVYPDPPLGAEERVLLSRAAPDMTITTPTSCAGKNPQGGDELPLEGLQVGLSISDSPDLGQLGMGPPHLQDAMLELARYLLAQGARLAYGGDLRPGGFTEQLLELVWAYDRDKREDDPILSPERKADLASRRLANYVAWPIHLNYSQAILAQHHLKGVFKFIDPPGDLKLGEAQQSRFAPPDTPEHRYWWFRSLTAMREQMVADIDARVVLGGQIRGYAGGIPGLVEEVLLALRRSQPVFLLGGMGGCARAIIDAIEGRRPRELTAEYQAESAGYAEFLDYVKEQVKQHPDAVEVDYQAMVDELQQAGVAGLNNGLSEAENRELFETPHIPVMVSLVLKGLAARKGKRKGT
ncbi:MAG: TIR domain-containing protein [Pseudomonadota bacterium]|nr:TIR domain-containing protein [Pseudomonadota bacterium]